MEVQRKLRTPEAAQYLGLSQSTLAKMRLRGDGPAYFKAGRRIVLYDPTDLEAWLAARRRFSTSEGEQRPCGEPAALALWERVLEASHRMARHPNHRLVKIHRSYSVDDVSRTLRVHKNTVRTWIKDGLAPIDSQRPTLIHGLELRHFLEQRRNRRKVSLQPGQIFCVRCRAAKSPAADMVDFLPMTMTSGNLRGICPDCDLLIHRRVSLARIDAVRGNLEIAFPQEQPRIRDRTSASVNCDLEQGSQNHENA